MSKFVTGQSGNPGGRPKKNDGLVQAARDKTLDALNTLASIMSNKRAPAAARVAAAREILDRGWGRPTLDMRVEAELTATMNIPAFVRPRTYTEWLEMRLTPAGGQEGVSTDILADGRSSPLMLADGRAEDVGDDVG